MDNKPLVDHSEYNLLEHLTKVGPDKPLGYLGFNDLLMKCGVKTEVIEYYLHEKGIKTQIYDQHECNDYMGAIYAFHESSLQKLLDDNSKTLKEEGWVVQADKFVENVARKRVKSPSKLFNLIADSFADYKNPLRTDN